MNAIDGLKLVADAHSYLRTVVAGVSEERWAGRTPCTEWTVRQVLNHARLDQQAYRVAITGEGGPESDPFAPADALDADPVRRLDEVLSPVSAAWSTVDPGAESVPTPLGPMPVWLGAGACALDAGVHAWDIAVATGQDLPMTEDLAEGLTAVAEQIVDHLRDSFGVFAPALPDPHGEEDHRAAALLRFLGRDPHWSRA
ncbi:TIGR03086 family metal-binding protein [Sphaerisporangium fuscum]|uniref:TIGR03086 family metal-binding protein n=1 Tax=Sphaerisporangium fuscum TaxID=2835868 RepID=UPI001BDD2D6A|nr:TIGR03086 family metal-binding protein [Sphaerisporangium fuscum]